MNLVFFENYIGPRSTNVDVALFFHVLSHLRHCCRLRMADLSSKKARVTRQTFWYGKHALPAALLGLRTTSTRTGSTITAVWISIRRTTWFLRGRARSRTTSRSPRRIPRITSAETETWTATLPSRRSQRTPHCRIAPTALGITSSTATPTGTPPTWLKRNVTATIASGCPQIHTDASGCTTTSRCWGVRGYVTRTPMNTNGRTGGRGLQSAVPVPKYHQCERSRTPLVKPSVFAARWWANMCEMVSGVYNVIWSLWNIFEVTW